LKEGYGTSFQRHKSSLPSFNESETHLSSESLSKLILRAREKRGLSQEQLAEKLGISQAMISLWENGKSEPSDETLQKMSAILGIDFEKNVEITPLGEWVSKTRTEKGLSRTQLAEKTGISYLTIYFIETGKTQSPQQTTLQALEKALGNIPGTLQQEVQEERQLGDFEFLGPFPIEGWEKSLGEGKIPCIYVFYDGLKRPVRIGETEDLRRRMKEYEHDCWWFRSPTVESFAYVLVPDPEFRSKSEKVMIKLVGEHAIFNIQEKI
jgi:transcriptional regulator with XRE-family HTH domain